jgi:uncharacterized protein involved in outer membrane biogenesis
MRVYRPMINRRKAALLGGSAILLLALAGAVALHTLVDPERLKELAREKAQEAWGRDLAIGDVSLDLWPVPTLSAENIALSNPDWAQEPHLLRADRIQARLELLPLITGKVRLKSLDIEGVTAELETSAEGASNVPASATKQRSTADLWNLASVRIRDADVYRRVKDAPPALWHIDEGAFDTDAGLRNARIEASLARNQFPLRLNARLDDLSRFGQAGATTNGKVDLDFGKTQLAVAGTLPLASDLRGYSFTVDLVSTALTDVSEFFELKPGPRAAGRAHLEIREAQGAAEIPKLDVALGNLHVTGDAKLSLAAPKKTFDARLRADRVDWAQIVYDAGGPAPPPLPPDQLFHDIPLAWHLLAANPGIEGTADAAIGTLKLRNGVEVHDAKSRITLRGDQMKLEPFTGEALGGTFTADMLYEGRRQSVFVDFHGSHLLLQRWFEERGSKIPLTGGPMRVAARFTATGETMKRLAASITGPISIRMGPAVWASKKAGEAEALMTNVLARKDADQIDFDCVVAALPFRNGVASGDSILGFSTSAAVLITSGKVDLREQRIEVSGGVKPKSGAALGLASIAGDVRIQGPLRHPKMALDPAGKPATVLRGIAAIATLGLSAVGTTLAEAAEARKDDPCATASATPPSRSRP